MSSAVTVLDYHTRQPDRLLGIYFHNNQYARQLVETRTQEILDKLRGEGYRTSITWDQNVFVAASAERSLIIVRQETADSELRHLSRSSGVLGLSDDEVAVLTVILKAEIVYFQALEKARRCPVDNLATTRQYLQQVQRKALSNDDLKYRIVSDNTMSLGLQDLELKLLLALRKRITTPDALEFKDGQPGAVLLS